MIMLDVKVHTLKQLDTSSTLASIACSRPSVRHSSKGGVQVPAALARVRPLQLVYV